MMLIIRGNIGVRDLSNCINQAVLGNDRPSVVVVDDDVWTEIDEFMKFHPQTWRWTRNDYHFMHFLFQGCAVVPITEARLVTRQKKLEELKADEAKMVNLQEEVRERVRRRLQRRKK